MVEQLDLIKDADRSLFHGSFTIRALRDSRYHNTAYALAELIDNSVEADAGRIELLCQERLTQGKLNQRWQLSAIAVLDNGTGMDMKTLLDALKFGGGTRHDSKRGIGKYGMGLPTSSMSQCKRVDVWTWQNGPSSAWHSSIDADAIEKGDYLVPVPDKETPIPEAWKRAGSDRILENESGTLVVWSNLDKVYWKTGSTLIEHTCREVGRIHRHFITENSIQIKAVSFRENRFDEAIETPVVANDPLYLTTPSSTPVPWDNEAMFKEWFKRDYPITVDGKEATIHVLYSIVKPEALKTDLVTQNPGATDHGKHARHNIGVSVVRESREIILEDVFLREGGSADDPQNRWWGCEVRFHRDCDELFGLDHNKQMASHFTHIAKTLARDDRPNQLIFDEMKIEERKIEEKKMHIIVEDIGHQIGAMMLKIKKMYSQKRNEKGQDGGQVMPEKKAAKTATDADQDAIKAGSEKPTDTDEARETISSEDRVAGLIKQFVADGQADQDAQQLAEELVREKLSYQFHSDQLDGSQMFNVRSNQGVLHINLNTEHPVYDRLKNIEKVLDLHNLDESVPAFQAGVTIRLLLSSWARMEDQTKSMQERTRIQDIAMDWGRQVHKAFNQLRERDG